MEVEKVKEMMDKMASLMNSDQSIFSKEYLMRILGLKKKDLRIEKINRIFDEF